MVVDDDDDVRDTMRELLEGEGYRVETAGDGRDALDLLESIERPGVILLDLSMPRMGGQEFLEEARKRHPELRRVPVVVVSGHLHSLIAARSVRRIFKKPVDLGELLTVIRQICRAPPPEEPQRHP